MKRSTNIKTILKIKEAMIEYLQENNSTVVSDCLKMIKSGGVGSITNAYAILCTECDKIDHQSKLAKVLTDNFIWTDIDWWKRYAKYKVRVNHNFKKGRKCHGRKKVGK